MPGYIKKSQGYTYETYILDLNYSTIIKIQIINMKNDSELSYE